MCKVIMRVMVDGPLIAEYTCHDSKGSPFDLVVVLERADSIVVILGEHMLCIRAS